MHTWHTTQWSWKQKISFSGISMKQPIWWDGISNSSTQPQENMTAIEKLDTSSAMRMKWSEGISLWPSRPEWISWCIDDTCIVRKQQFSIDLFSNQPAALLGFILLDFNKNVGRSWDKKTAFITPILNLFSYSGIWWMLWYCENIIVRNVQNIRRWSKAVIGDLSDF